MEEDIAQKPCPHVETVALLKAMGTRSTRVFNSSPNMAGDLNPCCGVLVVASKGTFLDMSSYAKHNSVGPRYKPSKFVMGI